MDLVCLKVFQVFSILPRILRCKIFFTLELHKITRSSAKKSSVQPGSSRSKIESIKKYTIHFSIRLTGAQIPIKKT
jgi:hypothetical protein